LKSHAEVLKKANEVRRTLDGLGLVTEIVAPRLWESSRTIDGAFTSNKKPQLCSSEIQTINTKTPLMVEVEVLFFLLSTLMGAYH